MGDRQSSTIEIEDEIYTDDIIDKGVSNRDLYSDTPGPRVIGTLLIIFSSIAISMGILNIFFTIESFTSHDAINSLKGISAMAKEQIIANKISMAIIDGLLTFGMDLLSLMALIAGIGLLRYREKTGRKLALVWAYLAFPYLVIDMVIYFAMVIPLKASTIAAAPGFTGLGAPVISMSSDLTLQFFSGILLAAMPIITIMMMNRSTIKGSCKG